MIALEFIRTRIESRGEYYLGRAIDLSCRGTFSSREPHFGNSSQTFSQGNLREL